MKRRYKGQEAGAPKGKIARTQENTSSALLWQQKQSKETFSKKLADVLLEKKIHWNRLPELTDPKISLYVSPTSEEETILLKRMNGHTMMKATIDNQPCLLLCVKSNVNRKIVDSAKHYFRHIKFNCHGEFSVSPESLARLQVMIAFEDTHEYRHNYTEIKKSRDASSKIALRSKEVHLVDGEYYTTRDTEQYLKRLISGEACGESPFPPHENSTLIDGTSVVQLTDQSEFKELNQIISDPQKSKKMLEKTCPLFEDPEDLVESLNASGPVSECRLM